MSLETLIYRHSSSLELCMNKIFSKSYIIPSLELALDYIVLDYCLLKPTCFSNAEDNSTRVTSLTDRKLSAPNITDNWTNVVKKISSTGTWTIRHCEAGLYARITLKKQILRKQNNFKTLQWAKVPNIGERSSGINSFGLTNKSLKSLGQKGGYMCGKKLMKEL